MVEEEINSNDSPRMIEKILYFIFAVLFISLFIITMRLQILAGNFRDGNGLGCPVFPITFFTFQGLWLTLLISLLAIIFLIVLFCKNLLLKNGYLFLIIILVALIFCLINTVNCAVYFKKIDNYNKTNHIYNINLGKLDHILIYNQSAIVYVGREDCPQCVKALPMIEGLSKAYDIQILYYSTKDDRVYNAEKMNEVMEKFQIYSVPNVLIIENGKTIKQFQGDALIDEFGEYINQNQIIHYQGNVMTAT